MTQVRTVSFETLRTQFSTAGSAGLFTH